MLLAALASICVPSRAEAQLPGERFSWERGPGADACISEQALREKIRDALGTDPFSNRGGPIVHGAVHRRGDELVATVRLREPGTASEATRQFHAPAADCASLTSAVALAVTLALSPPESREEVQPASVATPPYPSDWGVVETNSKPRAWAAVVGASWALGALPRPVAGVGLEVRYAPAERFAILAGGDWLPSASEGGQFSVGLSRARIGMCLVPIRSGDFSVLTCGTAEGGQVRVQNESATLPSAGSHPWVGGGALVRASARLGGHWVVEGGAGAIFPLSRPIYATPSCPRIGFQEPLAILPCW